MYDVRFANNAQQSCEWRLDSADALPGGLTGRVVPVSQSPRGLGGGLDKSRAFARRAHWQGGASESTYIGAAKRHRHRRLLTKPVPGF